MDDRPLLLLDVDGVLCPFAMGSLKSAVTYPGFEYHEAHCVHTSMDVADRIYRLMDHFDIHWCTGWMDGANEVIGRLMGLPRFPVVPLTDKDVFYSDPHWKWGPIKKFADRPYAFVDDEIDDDAVRFAKGSGYPHNKSLWLPVICDEGLNEGHVRRLITWADETSLPVAA